MSAKPSDRTLIEDLVARGVDDWIDPGLIVDVAKRSGVTSEAAMSLGLGLVAEVLFEGLMVPGDIKDGSFEPWDANPRDSFARVVRDWLVMRQSQILPGDIAWFANTQEGERLGQMVLRREGTLK